MHLEERRQGWEQVGVFGGARDMLGLGMGGLCAVLNGAQQELASSCRREAGSLHLDHTPCMPTVRQVFTNEF